MKNVVYMIMMILCIGFVTATQMFPTNTTDVYNPSNWPPTMTGLSYFTFDTNEVLTNVNITLQYYQLSGVNNDIDCMPNPPSSPEYYELYNFTSNSWDYIGQYYNQFLDGFGNVYINDISSDYWNESGTILLRVSWFYVDTYPSCSYPDAKIALSGAGTYIDYLSTPTNLTLTDGLILYYTFDDATNNVTTDSVGAYNGTIIMDTAGDGDEVATTTTGIINNAYIFNPVGANNYNGVSSGYNINNKTTISYWFNTTNTGFGIILGYRNYDVTGDASYFNSINAGGTGLIRISVNDGAGDDFYETVGAYNDGVWHHIVSTFDIDNDVLGLWIDGVNYTYAFGYDAITSINGNLNIGGYDDNSYNYPLFNGMIDEMAVYNRWLSEDEILTLYNNGTGLTYPFNETIINETNETFSYNITDHVDINVSGMYELMNDLPCEAWEMNINADNVELINPNNYTSCDPITAIGYTNLTLRGWNTNQAIDISGLENGNNNGGLLNIYNSIIGGSISSNGARYYADYGGNGGTVNVYNSIVANVYTNGVAGDYVAGSGGTINIFDSTTGQLQSNGADSSIVQGDAGTININTSTVGNVFAQAGLYYCGDGTGGTINILRPSTYGTLNVSGCTDGIINFYGEEPVPIDITGAIVDNTINGITNTFVVVIIIGVILALAFGFAGYIGIIETQFMMTAITIIMVGVALLLVGIAFAMFGVL